MFSNIAMSQISHIGEITETFDPLPASVNGPTMPTSGFLTMPLGYGTYVVLDGFYQSMFVVSTEGVILIDSPPTTDLLLKYAIGNVTDKPVTHMVYSHAHADHIGSAYRFAGPKVHIVAHEETLRLLKEVPSDSMRPLPTTTFKDNLNLVVGNQTVQLSYKGENHCAGNIFIYAEAAKVLMLVDVVFPGWAPFAALAESTNIPNWIKAHNDILGYNFTHYIGGHLNRIGVREDVLTQQAYVNDLFQNCKDTILLSATNDTLLGAGNLLPTVLKNNPNNGYAEFKVYLDIVAERCANITTRSWASRVGGVDAFGFENAYAMVESLRISFDILGPFRA
ncbi:Metallo-hydrolase/oxidoreductase [Microthyrium microscopicum]|uniref:Metallo-hydrolase/oxidoreductase n=1 Tax=Microthyrium microscopicum TaxID=703497 RepID=A0A6A6UL10_9PEZI|nr:Metallo-hydrolase/oxidoreductase [Microthyrium microscopicum]